MRFHRHLQQQAITVNAAFSQAQVDKILATFRLPFNTPLSVLAVELFNSESLVIGEQGFNADDLELNNANKARLLKTSLRQTRPQAWQRYSAD